jgi:hypothetical protein
MRPRVPSGLNSVEFGAIASAFQMMLYKLPDFLSATCVAVVEEICVD